MNQYRMEQLLERIEKQYWKFAKTYAKTTPHEYMLKEWNPELFKVICDLIDASGYEEKFYRETFKYYNIGELKYWCCSNVLNRCPIENRYGE